MGYQPAASLMIAYLPECSSVSSWGAMRKPVLYTVDTTVPYKVLELAARFAIDAVNHSEWH